MEKTSQMPLVIDFFTIQKYNNWKEFTRKDKLIMKAKYFALAAMLAVAVSVTGCAEKASLSGTTEGNEKQLPEAFLCASRNQAGMPYLMKRNHPLHTM